MAFRVEKFCEEIDGKAIIGQVTLMDKSVWIWVAERRDNGTYDLGPMTVGMPRGIGTEGLPVTTTLVKKDTVDDDISSGMCARLAEKHGIQCFASVTIPEEILGLAAPLIEKIVSGYL
jgi:hypothetical protein